MRKVSSITCFICFIFLLAAVATAAETIDREFEVRSGGTLEFDLDTGGEINIVGWNREAVSVNPRAAMALSFTV